MGIKDLVWIIYLLGLGCLSYLAAKEIVGKDKIFFYMALYIDMVVLMFLIVSICRREGI